MNVGGLLQVEAVRAARRAPRRHLILARGAS
jgi:hypothetical protein